MLSQVCMLTAIVVMLPYHDMFISLSFQYIHLSVAFHVRAGSEFFYNALRQHSTADYDEQHIMMNNIYNAPITSEQYEDITGQPRQESNCTVATALLDNAVALQYNLQFFGVRQENQNVLGVLC